MTTGFWGLIASTDVVSKGVLLMLLGMSITSWALALYKTMVLKARMKALNQAKSIFHTTKGMDDFLARLAAIQHTYAGELIATFLADFKKIFYNNESGNYLITDADWSLVYTSIQQRIEESLLQEESFLPVLSTNIQAAPLIGLFGTVWGLIHAFMAIAEQRTADISAVAPGIAEALLTTLAGLLVAIPALALCSYLQSQIRLFEQEINEVGDSCAWIMRRMLSKTDSFIATPAMSKQTTAEKEF